MHGRQSHGRLLTILAILCAPVGLGFGMGFWLSQGFQVNHQEKEDEKRLKQVSIQARMLGDMIAGEIEVVRLQVEKLAQFQATHPQLVSPELSGRILHWAEFEVRDKVIQKLRHTARNPLWNGNASIEETYLQSAARGLNPEEIFEKGVGIFRMKQDPNGAGEWLSLAFPYTPQGDGSPGEKSILLALINPSQAFSSFQRWALHSSGGRSRSYLIGGDGRVLAHSQDSLVSSDFSSLPIFRDIILKVIKGTLLSGFGDYTGIDHLPVGAAYFRVGELPLAAVVEEVNSARVYGISWHKAVELSLFALAIMSFGIFGSALLLQRYLVKVVTLTVRQSPTQDTSLGRTAKKKKDKFFSGDELLILDPVEDVKKGDA